MQFRRMKALLVPVVLGAAGAIPFMLGVAFADFVVRSPKEAEVRSLAGRARANLRTSAGADPETVWIGHVNTGGYGPYKIGRGLRHIKNAAGGLPGPTTPDNDGVWDFDHYQAGETDSLQGWWMIQPAHSSTGSSDFDDWARPWFGLDGGNLANYVPPTGNPKRTFGVVGIWHADNGTQLTSSVPGTNPVAPGWAPIAGTRSLWCGIRSHGDLTAMDVTGTGNPINDNVTQYSGNNSGRQFGSLRNQGTDHNFPGYGSQWDQMIYRDISFAANVAATTTITLSYATNMSEGYNASHNQQTGYFYFDPIKPVTSGNDGNFISAAASATGPVDSFMVYIGAPVNDASVQLSDGTLTTVFDPQRRWFSEVVKSTNFNQLLTVSGVHGTTAAPIAFNSGAISAATINAILDADGGVNNGGRVRLVFRVKTNRGFDDENNGNSGFSSGGAGAAIVDNVVFTTGATTLLNEGFEGTNGGVDNSVGTPATSAWKATGKPPQAWFHLHNLSSLTFTDPCGLASAAVRQCNMIGNVLSPGDHDNAEKPGGLLGANFQDCLKWAVSPTINMVASGVGVYNGMGIDTEIAARGNIILFADQLWNLYAYNEAPTGNGWRIGWQSWPATQANGVKCWGEMIKSGLFNSSGGTRGCLETFESEAYSEGLVLTTNTSGKPDSLRCYIESMARCFVLQLDASRCSPDPSNLAWGGGFFDNISIGFVTAPPPPQLGVDFARQFNDCFPVNSQNKPVNAFNVSYDTLAANIQTGANEEPNAKGNNISGVGAKENVPGDSVIVFAPNEGTTTTRVDMIFRILPGVGNYVTIGNRASGVARRPDTVPRVAATNTDGSNGALTAVDKFWGAYMGDNGAFGTGGNGTTGPGHGTSWNANVWNSARMDTIEVNFFPITGLFNSNDIDRLTPGTYMSTYHESDPKYTVLGIAKNRCFLAKNKQPVKLDPTQINCGNLGGGNPYPPAFYNGVPASGFNPSENGLALGRTFEYSKIIPDGQFTPGAHMQYFFRKQRSGDPITTFQMMPDTNFIIPNDSPFGNIDGHRWYTLNVLPDRWKDPSFAVGGTGMACMLVVDWGDRRGDEIIWVSMADSIGLTTNARRGASTGWRARPDQNIFGNVGSDDSICRRDNGGQAGSIWDLYQVVAGESNFQSGRFGSRGARREIGGGSMTINKWSFHGPSEDMLINYRELINLVGDVGTGETIGPVVNNTDNDIGAFTSFLTQTSSGSPPPRNFLYMGYDAAEGLATSTNPDLNVFMQTFLRASMRFGDYYAQSGNHNNVITLNVTPPVAPAGGYTYGVGNPCTFDIDVLNALPGTPTATAVSTFENAAAGNPYVAAVFSTGANAKTLLNSWTMGLGGTGFGTQATLLNVGIRKYFFDLFTNAFAITGCTPTGTPVSVGDQPNSSLVNFMSLKSSNPMRSGEARIVFGLAKTEKVEVRVYDVTGRLMKTVANRTFAGGQEHTVIWDGTNEAGTKVTSGVYFYQLRTPTWTSQKKLAVLAN